MQKTVLKTNLLVCETVGYEKKKIYPECKTNCGIFLHTKRPL